MTETQQMSTADLLAREAIALAGESRAILGIAGSPGAGKSTLVDELLDRISAVKGDAWVAHIPMDGFHLADAQLDRIGARGRKGAPDTFDVLGYAALLRRLLDDRDDVIYAPGFERVLEQPIAGAIPIERPARLIISEGNYLLLDEPGWQSLRPLFAEVWYADLDHPARLRRLIERHVRFGKDESAAIAWATGTDERNALLIAGTRDRADLIVPAALIHGVGSAPT